MIGAEVDLRAAIFIDGGYLQTQLKIHNVDADYAELADFFLSPLRASFPLDLLRCYYYYCAPYMSPEPTEDELKRMETHKKFVQAIQSLGRWAIRLGKLQKRWEGQREVYEQKRVDVLLSVDLVRHAAAGHIQHAILVAGDSDFVPAVEAAKEHGVTLTLWCGHYNTVNNDLIALADEVYTFDWNEFPRTATEGGAQTDPQRYKRRRRRGGRGRRPTGGDSSESSSQDGGARAGGRSQGSPGVPGRVAAQAAQKDGPKTGWRDRLRRMAGLK
jgi:uncharacterized LabA/DUF88 family protein